LDNARVKFYAAQIAIAIHYLHSIKIVHGEIKPCNILLDSYGYVKIADFGNARILGQSQSEQMIYSSPEFAGTHRATMASDWWGLGVLV